MLPSLRSPAVTTSAGGWTFEENKIFEIALAQHFHDQDKWSKIAVHTKKSVDDVKKAYESLENDMQSLYPRNASSDQPCSGSGTSWGEAAPKRQKSKHVTTQAEAEQRKLNIETRKGVSWTHDEHRLFLQGLAKFGKGSWRSIAKEFVITRTPTQVASHAQKYFLRLNSIKDKKEKRRASIHDMTAEHMTLQAVCCN